MSKRDSDEFLRRHQGNPDGIVRGIEQQAFGRPRRDHRDDGCLFFSVALAVPFALLAVLLRRSKP